VKVTVEHTPNSEATLTIELEWTELEKASDRAYREMAQRYNVPGFRRGHAPRSMLERMLGKEAIYEHGLEHLIEDSYRDAVRTNNLKPLGQPTVDAPPLEMGQPFTFTARVPVLTPVKLGDYKAVRVERPSVAVSDEDVEKVVLDLQQQQALWLPAERPAQLGDHVVADINLTVGERTISDLHDNEFELAETREGIFTGMDEHIVGMSEGETKEFTTTIPADYTNTDLAGQEAHYTVILKGVKYRELPEIDDELAKSAGDYQTLDDLRTSIREQLQTRRESSAEQDFRENLLKAVAEQAEVEIPPILIEDETGVMVREMQRLLEQSGLTWEQFLDGSSKSEAEYRKDLEPEAHERVRRDLVLDAIADAEGIETSDQEVQGFLDMLATVGGGRPMRVRQLSPGQRQHVVNRIRRDKVTQRLVQEGTTAAAGAEASAETSEAGAAEAARAGAEITGEGLATRGTPINGKAASEGEITAVADEAAEVPARTSASPDATPTAEATPASESGA
jgi:trigger factor